jgi:hypothetical protein
VSLAHGSEVVGADSTTAGNYDTAITPAATPNAVSVAISVGLATDAVTSVAYGTGAGAVILSRRRFDTEITEAGGVYLYWAAGLFPAGAQTVRVVRTGTASMGAVVSTMTVTDPVNFTVGVDSDATGTSASVANPSWTHTSLADNVVAYLGIHSGLQAMTATPATNWTLQTSFDAGAFGRGFARRTLATAGALAPGWTAATADDFRGSSIAFKEVPIAVVVNDPVHAAQAGRQVHPGRPTPNYF